VKVLFLDFDGVLHSTDAGKVEYHGSEIRHSGDWLFSRLDLLEELLTRCPDVMVVISSSWQFHYPLSLLAEFLGDCEPRVVGTTKDLIERLDQLATRYDACQAAAKALSADTWVMVDDQPSLVWGSHIPSPEEIARVVFCDPVLGLTPMVIDILARKLS
jgi:hypothetical protein